MSRHEDLQKGSSTFYPPTQLEKPEKLLVFWCRLMLSGPTTCSNGDLQEKNVTRIDYPNLPTGVHTI